MKYCFALCDDKKDQTAILQEKIRAILSEEAVDAVIDCFTTPLELIGTIRNKNKYDIIFLDMQMPEMNGIEAGKKIREFDRDVSIIYITGYVDFALNAFEIRALDYIVKPVNTKKLKQAILDAFIRIGRTGQKDMDSKQFLVLSCNKKLFNVDMEDIIYLEKQENKVNVICEKDQYTVYDSLANIRNKLDENMFLQTHQGYIVNRKKISRYENQAIILSRGYNIPVSKKNIKSVRQAFFDSLR